MVRISKTYTPKEKEKYMCAKHLAYFKMKLMEWKKDLKRSNNEAIFQASMDDNSASADIVDQASSYTEKNVEMRAINRQIKLISKIDGFKANTPEGAFYVFPDISAYFGKTIKGQQINNATDFSMLLLEEAHVATVTGDAFGEPNCIRISYAASQDQIKEALARIKTVLS